MPQKQNVTLVLPEDVLMTAKHLAVDERTTLSDLVARLVVEEAGRRSNRQRAATRVRERLESGYDLGTQGHIKVPRDELHER